MSALKPVLEYRPARVAAVRDYGNALYAFRLEPQKNYVFSAGQYVSVQFHDSKGHFERYFSIANAPRKDASIELCIQASEERLRNFLAAAKVGDEFGLSGSMGSFGIRDGQRPVVCIAGGTGIAPIRSLFESLTNGFEVKERSQPLHLLYGCRSGEAVPLLDDFLKFHHANLRSIRVCVTAEHGSDAIIRTGRVTDHLEEFLIPNADFYMCGPPQMLEAVRSFLLARGIAHSQIVQESHG